jgi:hypothetical protein
MTHSGQVHEGEPVQRTEQRVVIKEYVKRGASFGSALAMVISYATHKSVLWAIIHGLLSWLYVIYFLITRD